VDFVYFAEKPLTLLKMASTLSLQNIIYKVDNNTVDLDCSLQIQQSLPTQHNSLAMHTNEHINSFIS